MNRERPRILHISTVAEPCSGVGGIIHSLAEGARDAGYAVGIAVGRGKDSDADFVMQNQIERFINIFKARLYDSDGFLDSRRTKGLLKFIADFQPHIVHLHNLHGYYLNSPELVEHLKAKGIPIIITLHDLWMVSPHCAYPPADCTGKCEKCRNLRRYPGAWQTRRSSLNMSLKGEMLSAMTVVAPSEYVASRVPDSSPVLIQNGVDTSIFSPGVKSSGMNLLAVATRWHETKNPEALKRLASIMPEDWKLTVVGENAPVSPRIKTIKSLPKQELAKLMSASTVVLSPALHEAFGMTVLESLASGTPVVVQKGTAPEELIAGNHGVAVDFADPEAVIDAIRSAATMTGSTELTAELMNSRYLKLYDALIGTAAKK